MISLDEAKAHLRLELDFTEEDGLIQSLVDAAVLNLEHETGRVLRRSEQTLILDKWARAIRLPWWPVTSAVVVRYIDVVGTQQELDSFALDLRQYPATLRPVYGERWPEVMAGDEVIEIVVDVGMDELPADLKRAALLMVGHLYEHREAVAVGTIATALPLAVDYLVRPHRLMRIA